MAITKTLENDKIEVVNKWNIQVRTATVIKEDGAELTRSFSRKILTPGTLDTSDTYAGTCWIHAGNMGDNVVSGFVGNGQSNSILLYLDYLIK